MSARHVLDKAMSEAQWQHTVLDLARTYGWMALHVADSRKEVVNRRTGERRLVGDEAAAGLPDWLFIRERVVWVELKRHGGTLSVRQREVLDALTRADAEVYVWQPADYTEAERVLRLRAVPA